MPDRKKIEKRKLGSECCIVLGVFVISLMALGSIFVYGYGHFFGLPPIFYIIFIIIVIGFGFAGILWRRQVSHEAEYALKYHELKEEINRLSSLGGQGQTGSNV